MVLDFEGAGYINSTGIALIVGLLAKARARGLPVRAFGLTPHYREIFEITRLADFLAITADEDSAVARRGREHEMTEATATFDVRRHGPASVVDIRGDVTAGVGGRADGGLRRGRRRPAIVLNFTGLSYMNSGGIGLLVTLLVRANRRAQQLLAYGLSDHYRQIFELTRLDEAVGIHDTEQAALARPARMTTD